MNRFNLDLYFNLNLSLSISLCSHLSIHSWIGSGHVENCIKRGSEGTSRPTGKLRYVRFMMFLDVYKGVGASTWLGLLYALLSFLSDSRFYGLWMYVQHQITLDSKFQKGEIRNDRNPKYSNYKLLRLCQWREWHLESKKPFSIVCVFSESQSSHLEKGTSGPAHQPGPALFKKPSMAMNYNRLCNLTEARILTGCTQDMCVLIRHSVRGWGTLRFRCRNFELSMWHLSEVRF